MANNIIELMTTLRERERTSPGYRDPWNRHLHLPTDHSESTLGKKLPTGPDCGYDSTGMSAADRAIELGITLKATRLW